MDAGEFGSLPPGGVKRRRRIPLAERPHRCGSRRPQITAPNPINPVFAGSTYPNVQTPPPFAGREDMAAEGARDDTPREIGVATSARRTQAQGDPVATRST